MIFRTAHLPHARRPDRYGLTERLPRTYLRLLWHPFALRPIAASNSATLDTEITQREVPAGITQHR